MLKGKADLPPAAELTTAFVPLLLLEAQACQHVGNALVCIIPTGSLKLVHGCLQSVL